MPTYDYSCRSCGARFEAWQKMTDEPITICPTCGGPVHRIIYPVGLVFKGSGFYITDNSKSSNGSNGHHADTPGDAQTKDATPAATSASGASPDAGSGTGAKSAQSETKAASTSAASAAATPAASAKE